MMLTIPYPQIDPVALALGPFAIRWYALAYIVSILLGWRYSLYLSKRPPQFMTVVEIDDFLIWATLGVVLGGRTGYVLFYQPDLYGGDLLEIFRLWHGGMSFHGAVAGVITAIWLFTRRRGLSFLCLGDIIVCSVPIGQFFGRIANFVNGELWGRTSDVPWAMVFPTGGPEPRHPSQLYEAGLEGVVMFLVLLGLERSGLRQRPGAISGVFLIGLAATRIFGEFFRQPDKQLGFLILGTTMGQLLSVPMILGGLWLIWRAKTLPQPAAA